MDAIFVDSICGPVLIPPWRHFHFGRGYQDIYLLNQFRQEIKLWDLNIDLENSMGLIATNLFACKRGYFRRQHPRPSFVDFLMTFLFGSCLSGYIPFKMVFVQKSNIGTWTLIMKTQWVQLQPTTTLGQTLECIEQSYCLTTKSESWKLNGSDNSQHYFWSLSFQSRMRPRQNWSSKRI